ncbi:hypothetical protein ACOMHN_028422 [Nucella lapillus]
MILIHYGASQPLHCDQSETSPDNVNNGGMITSTNETRSGEGREGVGGTNGHRIKHLRSNQPPTHVPRYPRYRPRCPTLPYVIGSWPGMTKVASGDDCLCIPGDGERFEAMLVQSGLFVLAGDSIETAYLAATAAAVVSVWREGDWTSKTPRSGMFWKLDPPILSLPD